MVCDFYLIESADCVKRIMSFPIRQYLCGNKKSDSSCLILSSVDITLNYVPL